MDFEQRIPRSRSAALFEEAKQYFPGGVHSPVRAFKSVSGPPLFIESGDGCMLYDEDGNSFIDFCCSWGPLILGHNNAHIRERVVETVAKGTSFGAPTKLGTALGKLIIDNHPAVDMLRFVSSGTEAVMSAIRLARGATGRSKIIKFEGCYHGHVDSLMVKAGSGLVTFGIATSAGIPEAFASETLVVPLNDLDALHSTLQAYAHEVACIIIEPIPANNGLLLQTPEYLRALRQCCDEHGILLIFDEVISGFRVGFAGATGYYGIRPDLLTFGKIIGGGFPVGAYGGRTDLMKQVAPEGAVYQAGTLSANPVAMAAGYAALEQCLRPGFYDELEAMTDFFCNIITDHANTKGYPFAMPRIGSIFWPVFSRDIIRRADEIDAAGMEHFKVLHHELLQNGVYLGPSGYEVGFVSAAHNFEHLQQAAHTVCRALDVVFNR